MHHTLPDTSEHIGQRMQHTPSDLLLLTSTDRKLLSVQQCCLLVVKKRLLHAEGWRFNHTMPRSMRRLSCGWVPTDQSCIKTCIHCMPFETIFIHNNHRVSYEQPTHTQGAWACSENCMCGEVRLDRMAELLDWPYCNRAKTDGHYFRDQRSNHQRLRSCCVCAAACACWLHMYMLHSQNCRAMHQKHHACIQVYLRNKY